MITPSTLDFPGKLAFIHGVISTLSATPTDCLKKKSMLVNLFFRGKQFFSRDFLFHLRKNPRFHDEFKALIDCSPYLEAIYLTQQQRMFIQRQGENPREDKVSNDVSYMAFIAMAPSTTTLEYNVFSCKIGAFRSTAWWKITDLSQFLMKISA